MMKVGELRAWSDPQPFPWLHGKLFIITRINYGYVFYIEPDNLESSSISGHFVRTNSTHICYLDGVSKS